MQRTQAVMLDSAEAVIRSKLDDGETLVWSGRPRQGLLLQPSDALVIPFTLLWGGFAIFWEYEVVSSHAFWVLQVWGIPFVLLGIYLIVGRFFTDAAVRAHTAYGLTDKRIIIVSGQQSHSYALADIASVTLASQPDGSGTLAFGTPGTPALPAPASGLYLAPTRVNVPRFALIENAQSVYDQVHAQRTAAAHSA
ncbi:MAG: PH domain-containing protein [Candidatus Eremiobacteraeota bacterium]|nr:PH domain-containing protein [Candidatus Eremiobacteraeota bacterium]